MLCRERSDAGPFGVRRPTSGFRCPNILMVFDGAGALGALPQPCRECPVVSNALHSLGEGLKVCRHVESRSSDLELAFDTSCKRQAIRQHPRRVKDPPIGSDTLSTLQNLFYGQSRVRLHGLMQSTRQAKAPQELCRRSRNWKAALFLMVFQPTTSITEFEFSVLLVGWLVNCAR